MTRRIYSRGYKRGAAQLVTMRCVSVAKAARDLDVYATVLHSLRREVAKLKAERDILKMAAGYFARDQL